MIEIPVGNQEFRVFHFQRPDGRGQITDGETIQTAAVTAANARTGEAIAGMVSQAAPYDGTAVRYFVDPTAGGLVKRARVALLFEVQTSNGQTLTDTLQVVIV